ncbi:P-loop NTPase fold protein [Thioclava nitratireducens]|uniref:P-loop NTPase fold protein n=1 Tax=Thioclava nitratireducens TaxID=1915078 RepID=UPI002480A348|nr:P-loop NTPase fold protein [Thioclava nitratireducens]WGT50401.1 P-loop NTPase fold protein [Thioclava nitratireducens]
MSVDRTEVKKFLKNWANTKSKPHFAVLIEGRWGCGKTHFVTKLLEDDAFTNRKPIYLSVFGIADIQSLETSLFYASASKVTKTLHKGVGLAGSIFSGALTLGTGGILGGTANLNKVVDAATSQLEQSAKNMDGALLVLDDLERCQIPMSELLGVVNRFVEHGDTRVILCANTDDLLDDHFIAFKEKVVGHSFLLESDPENALASFVAEITQSEVSELLLHYTNDIRELYDRSGYHNLRALRQFVWQLASILEKMNEGYRKNHKLVQNLIIQFFIFFIEFKLDLSDETSDLTPSELLSKYDNGKDEVRHVYEFSFDKDKEPTPKERVFRKYEQHNGITTVVTVQQWISILTSGVVDGNRLNAELAQSNEVAGVASWPSWKRLWHLYDWDFSDGSEHEFWSDIEDMQSQLKGGSYIEVGEFLHVVGVSLMLADHELIDQTVPDTIAAMKTYIDEKFVAQLTDERCRGVTERFGRHLDSYDGLGFIGREDDEFREVLNYLVEKM